MLKFLDSKVNTLFHSIGAKAYTMKEARSICPHDFSESVMLGADGAYHSGADIIGVRDSTSLHNLFDFGTLDRNWIALHELIHWTKHVSRLDRNNKSFLTTDEESINRQMQTEELTAQIGMFLLVEYLGLDNLKGAKTFRDRYNAKLTSADYFRAEKDARIAVRFIKDLLEDSQMAA